MVHQARFPVFDLHCLDVEWMEALFTGLYAAVTVSARQDHQLGAFVLVCTRLSWGSHGALGPYGIGIKKVL